MKEAVRSRFDKYIPRQNNNPTPKQQIWVKLLFHTVYIAQSDEDLDTNYLMLIVTSKYIWVTVA